MSARLVNVHDAKTNLSRLLAEVEAGGEVIIGRAGRPIARLTQYEVRDQPRRLGIWRGRVLISADFDTLPPDLQSAFDGERE